MANQTEVVVIKPGEDSQSQESPKNSDQGQIAQAIDYGAMIESNRQMREKQAQQDQTMQTLMGENQSLRGELAELNSRTSRILQAIEEAQAESEQSSDEEESDEQTEELEPEPEPEEKPEPEPEPKKARSRANKIMFG